jgi:hypothetical protein
LIRDSSLHRGVIAVGCDVVGKPVKLPICFGQRCQAAMPVRYAEMAGATMNITKTPRRNISHGQGSALQRWCTAKGARLMMKMIGTAGKIALLASTLMMASCSSGPEAGAAKKTEFNIGWSIYAGWMPWPYAQQAGIVKKWADKYGIKINIVKSTITSNR